jgi:hypothetical protein
MGWFFVFSRGQNGLEIQLEFKAIRLLCVCLSLFSFLFIFLSFIHSPLASFPFPWGLKKNIKNKKTTGKERGLKGV